MPPKSGVLQESTHYFSPHVQVSLRLAVTVELRDWTKHHNERLQLFLDTLRLIYSVLLVDHELSYTHAVAVVYDSENRLITHGSEETSAIPFENAQLDYCCGPHLKIQVPRQIYKLILSLRSNL